MGAVWPASTTFWCHDFAFRIRQDLGAGSQRTLPLAALVGWILVAMRPVIHAACFPSWRTNCCFFFILILSRVPYCFSLIQRLDSSVFLADCNNLSFSLVSVSRSLYLFTEIGGKHLRELILVFHTGVGNQTQDVWLGIGFYKWNTVFLVTLLKTIVLYIHVFLFPTHIHRFLILHLSQQPFLALSPVQEGEGPGSQGLSFSLWCQFLALGPVG